MLRRSLVRDSAKFFTGTGGVSDSAAAAVASPTGRHRWSAIAADIADRQRYGAIHAYFGNAARQAVSGKSANRVSPSIHHQSVAVLPSHYRRLSSSSLTATDDKGTKDRLRSERAANSDLGGASEPVDVSTSPPHLKRIEAPHSLVPYHNYPRSLRELALRAFPAGIQDSSSASDSKSDAASGKGSSTPAAASRTGWARPSKDDLLRTARGFWTRARIRFKWFTIRGFRRFNADDISAFFTLGGLGTAIWIIVGTTTFFSVVFAALNALNLQVWIARKIADYLTAETGVTVVFESAIVPKWKDSRISFKNVFISRRAHSDAESIIKKRQGSNRMLDENSEGTSRRRWRTAATAGHGMAWEGIDYDDYEGVVAPPMSKEALGGDDPNVNTNFTMFDLNVDSIDVTLSLSRWLDGKGLIEDAVVKGVRGIVDRRNVFWDPEKPYDPRAARRKPNRGDFELESLVLEDFLVTVYQPGYFRPFNFSIFTAIVPKLRKQWLFYDLLAADAITGQVDGCLFSLHKPQSIGRSNEAEKELTTGRWKTISRFRVDGVNIDHIQNQSELTGPVSWIMSGRFDVVADIKFPRDLSEDVDINAIIAEIVDNLQHAVSGEAWQTGADEDEPIPGQHGLSQRAIQAPVTAVGPMAEQAKRSRELELEIENERIAQEKRTRRLGRRKWNGRREDASKAAARQEIQSDVDDDAKQAAGDIERRDEEANAQPRGQRSSGSHESGLAIPPPSIVIDMDVRFKDIKAAVPLFTKDLSYRSHAFVRPIVGFMNANRTLIPVHCRIVMDLSEFDGSMDLAQTGLLPVISDKIHEALALHVSSHNANQQRLRDVSLWSLRMTANAALSVVTHVRDALARSTPQAKMPEATGA